MTQNHKTIILEKQTRQSIIMEDLKTALSISDTSYVSLNVFLNTLIRDEREQDWFKCARLLQEQASKAGILEGTLRFPISTDHVLGFIQLMADEGWTLDDLPDQKPKEGAIKKILEVLVPVFQRRTQQWDLFMSMTDPESVTVYEHFYPYSIAKRLEAMTHQGMQLRRLPQVEPEITVKFAKNPRSEAQACVQDILSNPLPYDQQVIVCLDEGLQNQVETFLIRYDLPYFRVNEHKATSAFKLFTDLLQVRLEGSHEALMNLVENDRLDLPSRMNLIEYLKAFDVDVKTALNPFTHVETAFSDSLLGQIADAKAYKKLERKAEQEINLLRPKLQRLMALDPKDYESFIQGFFEFYVTLFTAYSEEDVQSINRIKALLEQGHAELKQMEDPMTILMYLISKQTISTKQNTGIILTDLSHAAIFGKTRFYFLGCTQDGYPQVPTHSGLFDEDYLRAIKGYDSKDRYDYHMTMLNKIRHSAKEIVYSYPLGSYEGKAQKLPYDLESYFEQHKVKASAWKIAEHYPEPTPKSVSLDPSLAHPLYFPHNELRGSVSSFERYFKCPYQYFLYTGIGLSSPDTFSLSNRELGTLLHYVLEEGVKEYGKHYASTLRGQEAQRIAPLIEALKRLFPHQKQAIELMRQRTEVLLKLSLEFLESRERNSLFSPYATEKSFDKVVDLGKTVPLRLVGFIDRIDITEDGFMIIDYKSSTKTLKENLVMAGAQIQLCTYLWMGHEALELKTPYGAFYFSLGQSAIPLAANDSNDPECLWKKSRLFNGWLTGDPHPVDLDGSHHKGLSLKNGTDYSFYGGSFKADAIIDQMKTLYGTLIDDLGNGTIIKRNKAGSCQYCPYRSFCQYKGSAIKIPSVTKADSVLR